MEWQLADAKYKCSEVVSRALTEGPQRVRRRGDVVVISSEGDYQRLTGERQSFIDFLLTVPDLSDLDLGRSQDPGREVEL
ncbi:MAG: type II toxin-antitoxin system prevent-host-death family antitoxin [Thermomicrobiales bacterium]